ncbi:hypothetical protein ABZ595_34650 [Streptomyces rubradiris]|uniref:hypothetical protein n=1 Tax=Streptomyces rubradiris TaxID=285531 RepID=UPI0033E94924
MAKHDDRADWVQAQADALYNDFRAREAAAATQDAASESTATVHGDHYGIAGGVHNGDLHFEF